MTLLQPGLFDSPPPPIEAAASEHMLTTLAEARAWVRDHWLNGVSCPCCDQRAQVYRRPIYTAMVRHLLTLYRADAERREGTPLPATYASADGHFHIDRLIHARPGGGRAGGDFAKLRFWGLVLESTAEIEVGARSPGWWRITPRGRAFCEGTLSVRQYVFLYNGQPIDPDAAGVPEDRRGGLVDVRACLGERFDYDALMGGLSTPAEVRSAA